MDKMLDKTTPVTVTTLPVLKPLELSRVKKHCEIGATDPTHDEQLADLIDVATEQWEADTDTCLLTQTVRTNLQDWCDDRIFLVKRPIQSVTSVKYYDTSDAQQTLSASVYSLDAARRELRLKTSQSWPAVAVRWDAIEIIYVAGHTSERYVPLIAKQAMLLLIGYYFAQNRGDNDRPNDLKAYENLVKKYMRSTYP